MNTLPRKTELKPFPDHEKRLLLLGHHCPLGKVKEPSERAKQVDAATRAAAQAKK